MNRMMISNILSILLFSLKCGKYKAFSFHIYRATDTKCLQSSLKLSKSLIKKTASTPLSSTIQSDTSVGIDSTFPKHKSKILFPGGGIFFYWQIGVVQYLRDNNYNLDNTSLAGASAGALSATLTATNVDFVKATELALQLAREAHVWDRPLGLQGVWGSLIEGWLDELLPNDAPSIVNERLALLITPVPSFGKTRVTTFENKEELIQANMASVHLPIFLDGKLTNNFRNKPHIDGSVFAKQTDYFVDYDENDILTIDWYRDPVMNEKSNDFVKLVSEDGIWGMLEQGKKFAIGMEERGEFELLHKLH